MLIVVGAMVVGNWQSLRALYYAQRLESLDRDAAVKLIEIGEPAIEYVMPLMGTRDNNNHIVGSMACGILAKIGNPAIPALEQALHHPDGMTRWNAVNTLARMAGSKDVLVLDIGFNQPIEVDKDRLKETIPTLVITLSDPHPRVKYWAAVTLKLLSHTTPEVLSILGETAATEDEVHLEGGSVYKGKVLKQDASVVVIQLTGQTKTLTLPKEAVEKILIRNDPTKSPK